MRKAYISIAALLLCGSMLMAQTPANRTAKTTAADVLAQMPAAKQAAYNKLIGDLSSTGEEGKCRLRFERSYALCHGERGGECPVSDCKGISEGFRNGERA